MGVRVALGAELGRAFHGLVCKHHLALQQALAPDASVPLTDPYALDQPD